VTRPGLAEARRAPQVTRHLAPLVPRIVAMGGDGEKRHAVGRHLRRTAERLQGIYPWLAELIGDVPMMTGADLARGIRQADPARPGPFVVATSDDGGEVLRPASGVSSLAADLNLASVLLSTIRPFTGALSPAIARALIEVVREQVDQESSLAEEARWRSEIAGLGGTVAAVPLARRGPDRWWQPGTQSDPPHPSPATYEALVGVWLGLVGEHAFVANRLTWENVSAGEGGWTITGRLAGSATARPATQQAVAALVTAAGSAPPELLRLLADDLGVDVEGVRPLAETVFSFVEPGDRDDVLGPRAALRALDAAARQGRPPQVHRDTFLVIRQLALLRSMTDAAGRSGHLLRPS